MCKRMAVGEMGSYYARPMNRKYLLPAVTLPLAVLAFGACSGDRATLSSAGVRERDSSGVRIIENMRDPSSVDFGWRVGPQPVLRIGGVGGDTAYQFDRISGIVVQSDGRMVVANGGTNTLRWYDGKGKYLFSRGRMGSGPGEFERLRFVAGLAADTIVAMDPSQMRLTFYSGDGQLGSTLKFDLPLPTSPSFVFRDSTGSWIVGATGAGSMQIGELRSARIVRVSAPLMRVSSDAASADTIGTLPGMEVEVGDNGFGPAAFGRSTSVVMHQNELIVGTRDFLGVDIYSIDGRKLRSIRAPTVELLMTPSKEAEYRAFLESRLALVPVQQRAAVREEITPKVMATRIPAYATMFVDDKGNVWLGEYRYDAQPTSRYLVMSPAGEFITRVAVPAGFTPLVVRDDLIFGRGTDSLDVQHVAAYKITRSRSIPSEPSVRAILPAANGVIFVTKPESRRTEHERTRYLQMDLNLFSQRQ